MSALSHMCHVSVLTVLRVPYECLAYDLPRLSYMCHMKRPDGSTWCRPAGLAGLLSQPRALVRPLSRAYGTYGTVKARSCPWLSDKSPQTLASCPLFPWKCCRQLPPKLKGGDRQGWRACCRNRRNRLKRNLAALHVPCDCLDCLTCAIRLS